MLESSTELKCAQNHDLPIQMVVLDPKLKKNERLLCSDCMDSFDSDARIIGYKKVIQMIEESRKKNKEKAEFQSLSVSKLVEEFQSEIIQLKSSIIQYLNELVRFTNDWIDNLKHLGQQVNETYSFFKELDTLVQSQKGGEDSSAFGEIDKVNYSWGSKLLPKLELFQQFQEFSKCQDCLKKILKEDMFKLSSSQIIQMNSSTNSSQTLLTESGIIQSLEPIQKEITQIKIKFIDDSFEQKSRCPAIAFDSKAQTILTSSNGDSFEKAKIQVWNYNNGKMKLKTTLQTSDEDIEEIIFSKKYTSFIQYKSIFQCWKYSSQNEWKSSRPAIKPSKDGFRPYLLCAELSSDESILFCGDTTGSIQIWKVEWEQNELAYLEELKRANERITALSLSPSGQTLAACSTAIDIWQKGESGQWVFKYVVKPASISQPGNKIKFLTDDQFIWIPKTLDTVCVFEVEEGFFQENLDKQLQLTINNSEDQYPAKIQYNKEKNVIVVLRKTQVHIIQKLNNGTFKIAEKLGRNGYIKSGALSENGQNLVLWDSSKKAFITYEIQYS